MNYLIFAVVLLAVISFSLLILFFGYKNKIKKIHNKNNRDYLMKLQEINEMKSEWIKRKKKFENELSALEMLRNEKLDDYKENNLNGIDSFFMEVSKSINVNENATKLFKKVMSIIRESSKVKSKLIMTLAEFKKQNGWDLIISLFGTYRLFNSSKQEKTSWIANFSPLRALLYPEYQDNYLDNTWISFEQEIHYEPKDKTKNYRPYRIDLLFISKLNNKYNIVLLEMKQTTFKKSEDKIAIIKDYNDKINKHWTAVSKKIKNRNDFDKLRNLGYLYNMPKDDVDKFNKEKAKWYSFHDNNGLRKAIYATLTDFKNDEKHILEEMSFNEVSQVLDNISKVKLTN